MLFECNLYGLLWFRVDFMSKFVFFSLKHLHRSWSGSECSENAAICQNFEWFHLYFKHFHMHVPSKQTSQCVNYSTFINSAEHWRAEGWRLKVEYAQKVTKRKRPHFPMQMWRRIVKTVTCISSIICGYLLKMLKTTIKIYIFIS